MNLLCVDPGVHTGMALFLDGEKKKPLTSVYHIDNRWENEAYRYCSLAGIITSISSSQYEPMTVLLEFPELWASAKSFTSATRGDIFKVAMLVGMIIALLPKSWVYHLVTTRQWKGQMTKEAVVEMIRRKIGIEYPNHIADAVGMGLWWFKKGKDIHDSKN